MKNLLIVQPVITGYRLPVFKELNDFFNVLIIGDIKNGAWGELNTDISMHQVNWKKLLGLYLLPRSYFLKSLQSTNFLIHVGDFKYLSLWVSILFKQFSQLEVYLHGQGGYKKNNLLSKLVYLIAIALSDGYICYSQFSRENLISWLPQRLHKKLYVVENTLYVPIFQKVWNNQEDKILFIGRLRENTGIEILAEAAIHANISIKVIGGGDVAYIQQLKETYSNLIFHGVVYEQHEIEKISEGCFCGAYGGDAGLSVVHYMALGLPTVCHSDLQHHMGPEPSYITNGENGLLFKRGDIETLKSKLIQLRDSKILQRKLGQGAHKTFTNLSKPSMAEKFASILKAKK